MPIEMHFHNDLGMATACSVMGAKGAIDAGVDGRVLSTLRQDEDHVVSLPCPETFYLKGLDIAVM